MCDFLGYDPIYWRKADAPEVGTWIVKLEGRRIASIGRIVDANYMTSNFLLRLRVNKRESLAHDHSDGSVQHAAVGVYGLSKRLNPYALSPGHFSRNVDGNLE